MIALFAAALLAAAPTAAVPDPARAAILTAIAGGDRAENGDIRFKSWAEGVGFVVTPDDDAQAAAIYRELVEASEHASSFTIGFVRASGVLETETKLIRYRACSIAFETATFTLKGRGCSPQAGSTTGTAALLSHGVAAAVSGDDAAAVAPLIGALADPALPSVGRAIALRERRSAEKSAADRVRGTARDRLLIAGLADARSWIALVPDDVEARLAEAADLSDLGAYDESIAAFGRIVARWPDEDYRTSIRIGAIRRSLGDNAGALAALDGLIARHGPQSGMRFHYHRGWTLTDLDRNEEALVELTAGIGDQPDYAWAFVRRACALGKLGRVEEASADQHRARDLFERWIVVDPHPAPDTLRTRAWVKDVDDALAARVRTDPNGITAIACAGYPDSEARRPRSALLPAAAAR